MTKNSNNYALLNYKNKEPKRSILLAPKNERLLRFKILKEHGQSGLFQATPNLLVEGDNLTVLKFLYSKGYAGKINLIYIDPPFSTNGDFKIGKHRTSTISHSSRDTTAYTDNILGNEYLEFLRKRLVLLRELLSKDGSIYVHIDNKVGHYVKILMDEAFGPNNFRNEITRIKTNPKNFERKAFGNITDKILFYTKSEDYKWNKATEKYSDEDVSRLFPKIDKEGEKYTTTPLHAPGETKNGATGREWKGRKPPKGRHWRYSPDNLDKLDKAGLIEWSSTGNPRKKVYASDLIKKGKKLQDVWKYKDPQYPNYPTEKNLEMLKTIVKTSSNEEDLVLDCFCGSGSTLVAAELLGRKWLGIDSSPQAIRVSEKRMLKEVDEPTRFKTCKVVEKSGKNIKKHESMDHQKYQIGEFTTISR